LQQYEEEGGITKMAERENRDVRVVKRHIEIAMEERDLGGARRDFIRGRLDRHQDDLLGEVSRLRRLVASGAIQELTPSEPVPQKVHQGFVDHIRRHSLNRSYRTYTGLAHQFRDELEKLSDQLASIIRSTGDVIPPDALSSLWVRRVVEGAMRSAEHGELLNREHSKEAEERGMLQVLGGEVTQKPLDDDLFAEALKLHHRLCDVADQWLPHLRKRQTKMRVQGAQVADEMDSLLARHMLPGKCRYCPV